MIYRLLFLASVLFCSCQTSRVVSQATTPFDAAESLEKLHAVARWQLDYEIDSTRWNQGKKWDWVYGSFYPGLMDFYELTGEEDYRNAMLAMAVENDWEPRPRPYDANDWAIVQTYADLYMLDGKRNPRMLDKSRFFGDMLFLRRLPVDVTFKDNVYWQDWWSWCDALFMAPPALTRLSKALGDPKYNDYMNEHWWKTSDYLYSPKDSLYYRDDTFFGKKSDNGQPIFWSRGNGWVIGGLAMVLDDLPADYPTRGRFETEFQTMMAKIARLQQPNGGWPSSLLDPENYTSNETSGTAFYCFGLAWGINRGLLDRATYQPHAERAWAMLMSSVDENGRLGYVQQIGDSPADVSADDSQAYGSGAFLMAGTQMLLLHGAESRR